MQRYVTANYSWEDELSVEFHSQIVNPQHPMQQTQFGIWLVFLGTRWVYPATHPILAWKLPGVALINSTSIAN